MFDAIVNRRVDLEGLEFSIQLADIETLNKAAFAGSAEITKLSYHAYSYCVANYILLNAGSALGWKCGPLLISKRPIPSEKLQSGDLQIGIPGKYTTANLLLSLAFPALHDRTELIFSEVESALLTDQYDAGLIIHEGRFTYEARGLKKIIDLGEFWDRETRAPLPLGGIVIKRSLSDGVKRKVDRVIRRSVEFALAHPAASRDFVLAHAQEISKEVVDRHIKLYVNPFSMDLGDEGKRAVVILFEKGRALGIIPDANGSLFLN